MTWDVTKPYNDLPLLPPVAELETRAVLKATIEARDALARFDAKAGSLPNPTVLINAIPLLEAQASSEIENIVTTTDELFAAAAIDINASPAAREALRYRTALYRGWEGLRNRPVTASTAIEVCAEIRGHTEGIRIGQVIIGEPKTHKRIYTPPTGRRNLDRLLDNWSAFINARDGLDPLVRMAVAHYQFEAIHPFTDGNGRTGRIMNILILCAEGLLQLPLLYLSRYIIETKDDYYRLLRAVTSDNAWEDWILYVVEGVRVTAFRSMAVVETIDNLQNNLIESIRDAIGVANHDLLSVLMEQPYARARDVVAKAEVSRPTANKWLSSLVSSGVLSRLQIGREVLYLNKPLMNILQS